MNKNFYKTIINRNVNFIAFVVENKMAVFISGSLNDDNQSQTKENQQDSGIVKTGYQAQAENIPHKPQEQVKLEPQTDAWAFTNHNELQKLQEQGLIDKPNVGENEDKKYNLPVDKWLDEHKDWQKKHSDWRLGVTSKWYESGNRGVGTISLGTGDKGSAHSTTKCDSGENCLTQRDDSQNSSKNARDLSFYDEQADKSFSGSLKDNARQRQMSRNNARLMKNNTV
ncbi:MAG: hypothetical protein IJ566_02285 [Cardiobacteriaceae bacterium]|nr:hypothetical protein [Cardiobacteriaceae bacterium]